jgi:hypothetical protein
MTDGKNQMACLRRQRKGITANVAAFLCLSDRFQCDGYHLSARDLICADISECSFTRQIPRPS